MRVRVGEVEGEGEVAAPPRPRRPPTPTLNAVQCRRRLAPLCWQENRWPEAGRAALESADWQQVRLPQARPQMGTGRTLPETASLQCPTQQRDVENHSERPPAAPPSSYAPAGRASPRSARHAAREALCLPPSSPSALCRHFSETVFFRNLKLTSRCPSPKLTMGNSGLAP